jgi:hypothetical protein
VRLEGLGKMKKKKKKKIKGDHRESKLRSSVYSKVPEPTALPRAPDDYCIPN